MRFPVSRTPEIANQPPRNVQREEREERARRLHRLRLSDYRVTGEELRGVALFALVLMTLTLIPYVWGVLICPPGEFYTGLLANPDDHNVYLSWMKQAEMGRWRFLDLFTPEPQRPLFFHAFFLVLGKLTRLALIPRGEMYHAARVLAGIALLPMIYLLAAQFSEERRARWLAVHFAALGSGLGWLFWLIAPHAPVHPVDFGPHLVMPEAITFLSLLLNPLFVFSLWLLAALFVNLLVWWRTSRKRYLAIAATCSLVLGNVHTYDLFIVAGVLALYLLLRWGADRKFPAHQAWSAAVVLAAAAPAVAYQVWYWETSPILKLGRELSATLSPAPIYLFAAFGLLWVLAAGGLGRVWETRDESLLLVAWPIAAFALAIWGPWHFQRKLLEGVQLPLAILGGMGATLWLGHLKSDRRRIAALLLVAALMPSNVFFVGRCLENLATNNAAGIPALMPPLRYSVSEVQAMDWLGRNGGQRGVVLCSPFVGSYLPQRAGMQVFAGHWSETVDFKAKLRDLAWFYSLRPSEPERMQFLRRWRVRYLFHGPYEAALGRYQPGENAYLLPVFQDGPVTVYQVRLP